MAQEIEIVFNEETGKFVIHPKSGFATHDDEHAMIDELIRQLQAQGFDVEVGHYHDKPKIPEVEDPTVLPPTKIKKGGGQ